VGDAALPLQAGSWRPDDAILRANKANQVLVCDLTDDAEEPTWAKKPNQRAMRR
jgi:hypothetical protein